MGCCLDCMRSKATLSRIGNGVEKDKEDIKSNVTLPGVNSKYQNIGSPLKSFSQFVPNSFFDLTFSIKFQIHNLTNMERLTSSAGCLSMGGHCQTIFGSG